MCASCDGFVHAGWCHVFVRVLVSDVQQPQNINKKENSRDEKREKCMCKQSDVMILDFHREMYIVSLVLGFWCGVLGEFTPQNQKKKNIFTVKD